MKFISKVIAVFSAEERRSHAVNERLNKATERQQRVRDWIEKGDRTRASLKKVVDEIKPEEEALSTISDLMRQGH